MSSRAMHMLPENASTNAREKERKRKQERDKEKERDREREREREREIAGLIAPRTAGEVLTQGG